MERELITRRMRESAVLACGLCLLAASALADDPPAPPPGAEWDAAQLVKVELVDDRFVPEKLTFRVGVPYRIHLENTGTEMHEFTAPEFFRTVTLRDPKALDVPLHEATLQPKTSRDIYLIPHIAGRYPLTCADHDWAGMTGEISVE